MRELSLFSGAGGGLLGSHLLGWTPVGYVEWDEFCCRVLEQRIKDGFLPDAPVFQGDIREFVVRGYAGAYQGLVDIVTGGPPCQGFSEAGKKLGESDPRNMVPAMLDVVEIVRPAFVLMENAPSRAFRCYMLEYILPRLAHLGFDASWGIISAQDAIWHNCYPGVPAIYHERKRTWILAASATNAEGLRCDAGLLRPECGREEGHGPELAHAEVADSHQDGCARSRLYARSRGEGAGETDPRRLPEAADLDLSGRTQQREREPGEPEQAPAELPPWWSLEPAVDRLVHGVPDRVDRIRASGNAQVPYVEVKAWELLR